MDGGAKVCVMSEPIMHCLGLEVDGPAPCKTKLANNTNVHCVGHKCFKSEELGHRASSGCFCDAHQGGGISYDLREAMAHGHEGKTRLGHRSNQVPTTRTQGQGDLLQHKDKETIGAGSRGFRG